MVNFKCKIGTDIYIVSEHMTITTVSCSHRLKWLSLTPPFPKTASVTVPHTVDSLLTDTSIRQAPL